AHRRGWRQSDVAHAGDVARSPWRRWGQALASLATPRLEHLASTGSRHPDAKPVGLAPVLLLGLVGPLDVGDSAERRFDRSEEHTSELQSLTNLVCRLL